MINIDDEAQTLTAQGYTVSERTQIPLGSNSFDGYFARGTVDDSVIFLVNVPGISGNLQGNFITPPGQLDTWLPTLYAMIASLRITS